MHHYCLIRKVKHLLKSPSTFAQMFWMLHISVGYYSIFLKITRQQQAFDNNVSALLLLSKAASFNLTSSFYGDRLMMMKCWCLFKLPECTFQQIRTSKNSFNRSLLISNNVKLLLWLLKSGNGLAISTSFQKKSQRKRVTVSLHGFTQKFACSRPLWLFSLFQKSFKQIMWFIFAISQIVNFRIELRL